MCLCNSSGQRTDDRRADPVRPGEGEVRQQAAAAPVGVLYCNIIETDDLEHLTSPSSPAVPLIRARMHQRRGSRSGSVVIPLPCSTIVHHAAPKVPRHVLIAMFWGYGCRHSGHTE
jgi:hypothetical protein